MENRKLNVVINDTSDNIYLLLQTLRLAIYDLSVEYKAHSDIDVKNRISNKMRIMDNLVNSIGDVYWNK